MIPVASMRRVLGHLQARLPSAGGTSILAYHLVGAGTDAAIDLPASQFREQLSQLRTSTASVIDLPAFLGSERPGVRIVLTFDDAYGNFADIALPILEEFELPATLYVPTGFIDGTHPSPIGGLDLPALSWSALRDLARHPLVHIGSHSYAHVDMRRLSPSERLADLKRARATLEDQLGVEVSDFCYPQAKWSPACEPEVRQVYRSAAIAGGGRASPDQPLRLQRRPLRRDSGVDFETLVRTPLLLEERLADLTRRYLRR